MFLIYGWGHQRRKNHGPVFKKTCPQCQNEKYWQLIEISTWITIFFIPVIPYKRTRVVLCPVCGSGVEVEKEKFNELKKIAQLNTKLIKQEITKKEYEHQLKELDVKK